MACCSNESVTTRSFFRMINDIIITWTIVTVRALLHDLSFEWDHHYTFGRSNESFITRSFVWMRALLHDRCSKRALGRSFIANLLSERKQTVYLYLKTRLNNHLYCMSSFAAPHGPDYDDGEHTSTCHHRCDVGDDNNNNINRLFSSSINNDARKRPGAELTASERSARIDDGDRTLSIEEYNSPCTDFEKVWPTRMRQWSFRIRSHAGESTVDEACTPRPKSDARICCATCTTRKL